eukprot:jgi/Botrbrau1/1742/Bobra.116_2s0082.1
MLKPYEEGGTVQPPPVPHIIDGEEEYEVEVVLAHREQKLRGRKTAREYLVKWTGRVGPLVRPWATFEALRLALRVYPGGIPILERTRMNMT